MADKILVVDNDANILETVRLCLEQEGFRVITAMDGADALIKTAQSQPDLVVLDLMLPKINGFDVCKVLTIQYNMPIIILSAKGDELDRIIGFKMGVDDYLTKPFSPIELVLRVKAVLRRVQGRHETTSNQYLDYGCLRIDFGTREVIVNDRVINLTNIEFEILWLLASNSPKVFSKIQLLNKIWHSDYYGDENTVTVHIRRLREKIEPDPSNPRFVHTVWGVGYKFSVNLSNQLDSAEKEPLGPKYVSAVRQLIDDLQKHRGMANVLLNGDNTFYKKLIVKEVQIDDDIKAIDTINQLLARALKTHEQWNRAKAKWTSLQSSFLYLSPLNSFNEHTALIDDILSLSSQVAGQSNLLLDPSLDTNYLIDVDNKLLLGAEKMSQVRGMGSGVAVKKAISLDEKIKLSTLADNIQAVYDDIDRGLVVVFTENPWLKAKLAQLSQDNSVLVKQFLATLHTKIINAVAIKIKTADYFDMATKVIDSSYHLYDAGIVALDHMLKKRIGSSK